MSWGDYWGEEDWGSPFETAATLLLYMTRMGPNFRSIVDIIDTLWLRRMGVMEQLLTALNLDTAYGDRLDKLGSWLGQERDGLNDDRYRAALRVQILLLHSRGSSEDLLNVFETWTGAEALEYITLPPAQVRIGGAVAPADESLLVQFLNKARPGGVVLGVVVTPLNPLYCDVASNPLADPGIMDVASDPVGSAGRLSSEAYA